MINRFSFSIEYRAMGICFCLFLFLTSFAWADLSINLIAVNASAEVKKVPVKFYLPRELAPEDVKETGPLKIDYDVDKGEYFVYGDFEFQPKETKTYKILVKDVWYVTEEEINLLKKQLEENLALIKDKEKYAVAETAKNRLVEQLDYILAQQVNYSEDINRRIEEYRAYADTLEDIRRKTFSLEFLAQQAKSIADVDETKTVKFILEVKNPSETEEKAFQQKHYLPKEIRSEHIVDAQGFDVRYDHDKQKYFLTKEEKFKPGEIKKYEIVIRDIWHMPLSKVDSLEERAQTAMTEVQDSAFAASGDYLFNRVKELLDQIRNSQQEGQIVKDYIGSFRVNQRRYSAAEADVQKLEQMLAIVRAKKLEELEKTKVKNILQKLQALRGLAALSEAIFKKGISVTATWRIIMATLIFLAFFTTWHFITWIRRSKTMGEEHGPKKGETIKEIPKPGVEPVTEQK